jgi:hypothetical protein
MSPVKKSSRHFKMDGAHGRRRTFLVTRLLGASAVVLIAAGAPTHFSARGRGTSQRDVAAYAGPHMHAPPSEFASASSAQSPKQQQESPVEINTPQESAEPALVAKPRSIMLCPGRPTNVNLTALPPARGTPHWDTNGAGRIISAGGTTAVWDLSGVKPGTYTVTFTRTIEGPGYAAVRRRASVEVRECSGTKPPPTPEPEPTCAVFSLRCPESVVAGRPLSFTATMRGDLKFPKSSSDPWVFAFPAKILTDRQTGNTHTVEIDTTGLDKQWISASYDLDWHGMRCTKTCGLFVFAQPALPPTPQGNVDAAAGALTPTPPGQTPSPTPNSSASPIASPATSGASPPPSASPAPTGDSSALALRIVLPASLAALTVAALLLAIQHFGGVGGMMSAVAAGLGLKHSDHGEQESADVGGEQAAGGVLVGGQEAETEEVHCTVFAPLQASPGDSFLVQVFAHLAEQARQLAAMAKAADADAMRRDSVELDERIERGQELVFQLTMHGLDVREPTTMPLVWKGKPKSVKFDVYVPDGCPLKDVTGTVDVYLLNVPIGKLRFKLEIVARTQAPVGLTPQPVPGQKFIRYRYAFISYASEDRAEVLRRVQVLPLVQIDYFQDITSLDPGDRWAQELYKEIDKSDVFFLFWSKAARDSEWVEREVLYALEHRHGDDGDAPDIKPVILGGPPPVTPPERLRSLHFNDKITYFISVEDSLREARKKKAARARRQ